MQSIPFTDACMSTQIAHYFTNAKSMIKHFGIQVFKFVNNLRFSYFYGLHDGWIVGVVFEWKHAMIGWTIYSWNSRLVVKHSRTSVKESAILLRTKQPIWSSAALKVHPALSTREASASTSHATQRHPPLLFRWKSRDRIEFRHVTFIGVITSS
jgi:hypothetical protein